MGIIKILENLSVTSWAIALAALCATPASAQNTVEWLTERDHDFGQMRQHRAQTHAFRFKNASNTPIVLQTVRTTCGCTAAKWTETAIAPGETGEVEIEYDAYHRGAFSKKIRVFFDRQRKPEILWVRGKVE